MSAQYFGRILDTVPFVLPTETEDLAHLIYTYSYDWAVTLDFLDKFAQTRGIIINTVAISEEIRSLIGEPCE